MQASLLQPAQPGTAGAHPDDDGTRGGLLARAIARVDGGDNAPGKRPRRGRPSASSLRRSPALGVLPLGAFVAAAVVGAIVAGASAIVSGCLIVLGCGATALGWRLGD